MPSGNLIESTTIVPDNQVGLPWSVTSNCLRRGLKFSDLPIGATFTLTEGSILRRIKVTPTSWITVLEEAFLAEFRPEELSHPVYDAAIMEPNKSNDGSNEWVLFHGK